MLLKDGKRYSNVKKIICLMLVLFNMLVYLPVISFGADGPSLNVGSATGKKLDIIDIPIKYSNIPSSGVGYFSFTLKFDKYCLKKKEIIKNSRIINNLAAIDLKDEDGDVCGIEFSFFSLQEDVLNNNEEFAKIRYEIIDNSNSDLTIEDLKVWTYIYNSSKRRYELSKIDCVGNSGKVSISASNSPTPTNTPKNTPTNTPTSTPKNTPTNTLTNTPTNTPTISTTSTPTPTPSKNLENGLLGEYYQWDDVDTKPFDKNLKRFERVDKEINFDWGTLGIKNADGISTPSDYFSVRWTGYFVPEYSGNYKFQTKSDDGVRLYFDQDGDGDVTCLFEDWKNHSVTKNESTAMSLNKDKAYKIVLEYYENDGEASVQLLYSLNNYGYVIVPAGQLKTVDPSKLNPTSTTKVTPTPTSTAAKTSATPTKASTTAIPTPTATSAPYIPPSSGGTTITLPTAVQPLPTAVPQVIPSDLSLALSSDKTAYDAGQNILFSIHYRNRLSTEVGNVKLSADIPPNTTFVDSSGGVIAGNKITWDLGTLQGNNEGTVKYTVKANSFDGADKETTVTANISSTNSTDNTVDDNKSVLKIMLYAKKAILGSHKKYINGYKDGTFKPDKPITRAEISALIVRVSGLSPVSDKQIFKDVSKDHWAFKEVNAAVSNGYFKGATATLFKPDSNITKGELAAVICRCLGMEESSIDEADFFFSDTKNYWAGKYIEELYRCKIVVGSAGKFYPKNQVTRAEAVTMINRWLYRGPLNGKTLPFKDVPTSHWGYGHIAEAVFDHKYSRDPKGGEKYED
ncbi:S-layer homology domain-containing protein [Pseudobacteroides cellulosolvens]|uniref:PA14 domain protein n=1 Tax=Pseudobacteroides cellulosolvens ATCC 35603 = DSM 2933 TaxID=398512 RepID=A0A0L6JI60_9FIRM|nr:S-layer homology domain-containing protein [Pseudobacteroides cellulosolvens]KNY25405.1 PA14 domain protein [Pseudobacteroides cellulosolvens ATCC 35603 = DSM 2933]